jgi:EAL domain-containing protein (putative c-di-GMP-specific phosphodiesterase class I)
VAEGIEEAAQVARLRELGCARGQGYLFARPLAAVDVPRWLGEWAARRAAEEAAEQAAGADGALGAADPLTPTRA